MDCAQDLGEGYTGPERRIHWPTELDVAFWRRLYLHMVGEDQKFKEGADRMNRIEKDLQPLKKMYWAIVGSAGIGTLLLCLLTYVYIQDKTDYREDKAEYKKVQVAIIIQGEAIKELMTSQRNLEQSYHRDMERIERGQDRLLNQSDKREQKRSGK